MKTNRLVAIERLALCFALSLASGMGFRTHAVESWPQFRGPNGSGVAEHAQPPVTLGPTNGPRWCIEVPWSPSSPSVWGDRLFLTTFADGELQTRAYATGDGHLIWSKGIKPGQLESFHGTDGSPAASTPATDGKHVVSYFGSFGVICYDLKGKELWRRPFSCAVSGGAYGTGTSPILAHDRVVLNRDLDGDSLVCLLKASSGKTIWETPRPDAVGSFGTPIVWHNQGFDEIVTPGSVHIKGYDFKTGHERWVVEGTTGFACTTPVLGDGMLFYAAWSPGGADAPWPSWETFLERNDKNHDGEVTFDEFPPDRRDFVRGLDRDHDGKITRKDWEMILARAAKARNLMLAIRPGGSGDITQTHVAWTTTKGLPYVPSPLYYQGRIYLVRDGGMMSSFDAKSGNVFYSQERLEAAGSYYSSPVAADGRIYVASLPGKLSVIKAGGDHPEILHQADFGERIFASPAIVGRSVYLRTQTHLYAFGQP